MESVWQLREREKSNNSRKGKRLAAKEGGIVGSCDG